MKWPFVFRKRHEEEVSLLKARAKVLVARNNELDADIEKLLRPMVEKFCQTQIRYNSQDFHKYAVQVAFDTGWVEQCLIHGDSQIEIHYLSEMMGKQVMWEIEHLIKARNIIRI